jgi:hypothetical protein
MPSGGVRRGGNAGRPEPAGTSFVNDMSTGIGKVWNREKFAFRRITIATPYWSMKGDRLDEHDAGGLGEADGY